MKKLMVLVVLLAVVMVSAMSCDNRSQMEKDADAAAKKVSSALK